MFHLPSCQSSAAELSRLPPSAKMECNGWNAIQSQNHPLTHSGPNGKLSCSSFPLAVSTLGHLRVVLILRPLEKNCWLTAIIDLGWRVLLAGRRLSVKLIFFNNVLLSFCVLTWFTFITPSQNFFMQMEVYVIFFISILSLFRFSITILSRTWILPVSQLQKQ